MGAVLGTARADTAPPPLPNFSDPDTYKQAKVDYMNLPQPVKYEDISREVMMSLKPEMFEGFRFDLSKPLNGNFFLTHSISMGNFEMPTAQQQLIKMPFGAYEFGANVIFEKFFMLGRVTHDGRLSGRVKLDITDNLSLKVQTQLASEPGQSQVMFDADVKGKDWNGQLKAGNPNFYGINYFQSVTDKLSVGGEFFFVKSGNKSGLGVAVRHSGDKHIAVAQLATTGILSLQYAHKVTDKVTLASDFLWHWSNRESTATVGYDCNLRQCRLRGKVDSHGVVGVYIEERFNPGLNFLLSGEIDHKNKNYKFGFGVSAGE